jgi:tetratricopeptide (TPR) repeat protein
VRSSAITGLAGNPAREAINSLVAAAGDGTRLVRIRAAASLSQQPSVKFDPEDKKLVDLATGEYEAYLKCRPDQWSSHYNLGNYYVNLGRIQEGLKEFNIATRLQPQSIPPLVNASMIYARLGDSRSAEDKLRKALEVDPDNAVVNFNLGLLLAEQGQSQEAEQRLKAALAADPQMSAAAYNLAVLVAPKDPRQAVKWCRQAVESQPDEPKYVYTLAFYLDQSRQSSESVRLLRNLIQASPSAFEAYALLGSILERQGKRSEAARVYGEALATETITPATRRQFEATLARLNR